MVSVKSKPRTWVLFENRSGMLYISDQKGTPLYELEALPHFRGAYRSISQAERAGIARLQRDIEVANERIGTLINYATDLEHAEARKKKRNG